jgi:chaperonin GroES
MNLEAMFDAVIVKPLKEEETMYGNIIVPDLGKDKNEHGEVVAVGPGKYSVTGDHFLKTQVLVGDVVVLPTMGFTKLEHEGEEFFVGPEAMILAKIKK